MSSVNAASSKSNANAVVPSAAAQPAKLDIFTRQPGAIQVKILFYLAPESLGKAACTHRTWQVIANHNAVWKHIQDRDNDEIQKKNSASALTATPPAAAAANGATPSAKTTPAAGAPAMPKAGATAASMPVCLKDLVLQSRMRKQNTFMINHIRRTYHDEDLVKLLAIPSASEIERMADIDLQTKITQICATAMGINPVHFASELISSLFTRLAPLTCSDRIAVIRRLFPQTKSDYLIFEVVRTLHWTKDASIKSLLEIMLPQLIHVYWERTLTLNKENPDNLSAGDFQYIESSAGDFQYITSLFHLSAYINIEELKKILVQLSSKDLDTNLNLLRSICTAARGRVATEFIDIVMENSTRLLRNTNDGEDKQDILKRLFSKILEVDKNHRFSVNEVPDICSESLGEKDYINYLLGWDELNIPMHIVRIRQLMLDHNISLDDIESRFHWKADPTQPNIKPWIDQLLDAGLRWTKKLELAVTVVSLYLDHQIALPQLHDPSNKRLILRVLKEHEIWAEKIFNIRKRQKKEPSPNPQILYRQLDERLITYGFLQAKARLGYISEEIKRVQALPDQPVKKETHADAPTSAAAGQAAEKAAAAGLSAASAGSGGSAEEAIDEELLPLAAQWLLNWGYEHGQLAGIRTLEGKIDQLLNGKDDLIYSMRDILDQFLPKSSGELVCEPLLKCCPRAYYPIMQRIIEVYGRRNKKISNEEEIRLRLQEASERVVREIVRGRSPAKYLTDYVKTMVYVDVKNMIKEAIRQIEGQDTAKQPQLVKALEAFFEEIYKQNNLINIPDLIHYISNKANDVIAEGMLPILVEINKAPVFGIQRTALLKRCATLKPEIQKRILSCLPAE